MPKKKREEVREEKRINRTLSEPIVNILYN